MQKLLRNEVVCALAEMQPYVKRVFNFKYNPSTCRVIVRTTGRCSYGGLERHSTEKIPYFNLTFVDLLSYKDDDVGTYCEYEDLAHDTVIGDIDCDWKTWVRALVAHELAHAIDHACCYTTPTHARKPIRMQDAIANSTHGQRWQHIYRLLRKQFVNSRPNTAGALSKQLR